MTEHLGHEKNRVAEGRDSTNVRNGVRLTTVLTGASGPVELEVPCDLDGTFEPVIVRKRQRRLGGVDEIVLSLYARGLTSGEISAHFEQVYVPRSRRRPSAGSPTSRRCRRGPLDRSMRSTRRSSSMQSWSRSATARSPTGRSTQRSGSAWPGDLLPARGLDASDGEAG